jgi:uncharacterized repeat protein (TIGR01451 family)
MTTKAKQNITSASLFVAGLSFVFGLAHFNPVLADTCTTQYGGQYGTTTTCVSNNISINKKVADPTQTNVYVDNLFSDKAYSPETDVVFQIAVTNTSSQSYNQVTVTDTLPNELTFQSGPGSINGQVLTYTITNLGAGQTETEYVMARVKAAKDLPKQDMNCDIKNTATVKVADVSSTDTSALCVQTKVLGASTLPVAGFNDFAMVIPFATSGFMGLVLLKKRPTSSK